jgi:hypothetical protein
MTDNEDISGEKATLYWVAFSVSMLRIIQIFLMPHNNSHEQISTLKPIITLTIFYI